MTVSSLGDGQIFLLFGDETLIHKALRSLGSARDILAIVFPGIRAWTELIDISPVGIDYFFKRRVGT